MAPAPGPGSAGPRGQPLSTGSFDGTGARAGDGWSGGGEAGSGQVELAVLDAEGECFPFLGGEREHRAVRVLGIAHQVELLAVRLVWPAGGVSGDRDLDAVVILGGIHCGIALSAGEP